ncbi:hypothetical protein GCM10010271_04230 [Streptomyces kurssanovii]|nr:hypothetical protein GCM10010271_04230 [Streptomyces kurssanovii]
MGRARCEEDRQGDQCQAARGDERPAQRSPAGEPCEQQPGGEHQRGEKEVVEDDRSRQPEGHVPGLSAAEEEEDADAHQGDAGRPCRDTHHSTSILPTHLVCHTPGRLGAMIRAG